jgi:hypothetical protein
MKPKVQGAAGGLNSAGDKCRCGRGGAVFDLNGASGVFAGSGLLLVTAMVIVFMGVKVKAE